MSAVSFLVGTVRPHIVLFSLLFALFVSGCSDGSDNFSAENSTAPYAELYAQGIARYLGVYTPMLSEQDGDVVNYFFGQGDGPLCGEGAQYTMSTRDQGSDELLIFLEGGGACWSDVCIYVSEVAAGIPQLGLLDPTRTDNPVGSWNQVYVPNCDGSLLSGDKDLDLDGDGLTDRYHRGLHNLSAALDVARSTFQSPKRVLLAGQSAGGLGSIFALPLVRKVYPDADIVVLNDSGVGVARPGKPEFMMQLLDEWNMWAFIPESCPECIAQNGHFTDYLLWQMEQDPKLRRGFLSYSQDTNLSDLFLQIGGAAFQEALLAEMARAESVQPDRVRSWIPEGAGHTFVTLEPEKTAGGVPLMGWIGAMLDDSPQWTSVRDEGL